MIKTILIIGMACIGHSYNVDDTALLTEHVAYVEQSYADHLHNILVDKILVVSNDINLELERQDNTIENVVVDSDTSNHVKRHKFAPP